MAEGGGVLTSAHCECEMVSGLVRTERKGWMRRTLDVYSQCYDYSILRTYVLISLEVSKLMDGVLSDI